MNGRFMTLCDLNFNVFRGRPGWFVWSHDYCSKHDTAEEVYLTTLAKSRSTEATSQDYQLFCGLFDEDQGGHTLFAIHAIHPCNLILEFKVGSHNQPSDSWARDTVHYVFEQMCRIYEVRKFRPYFVDAAGYHCVFEGQISLEEARKVESLMEVGVEYYASHDYPEDDPSIAPESSAKTRSIYGGIEDCRAG
jgi:hypothetical protein